MKKSILWTAAGVVSATALWAAISLPQHTPVQSVSVQAQSAPVQAQSAPVQAQSTQDTLIIESPYGRITQPLTASQTFSWDGRKATIMRHGDLDRLTISWSKTPEPVMIVVTKQHVENSPHYYARRATSYNRQVQVGDTFDL